MTMENEVSQSPKAKSKMLPVMIIVVIVVVILVGAIAFSMSREPQVMTPEAVVNEQPSPTAEAMTATYKDGTYNAIGEYTSPGGAESLDVTLTLKGGIVKDAEVVSKAFRPTSKQMQASFIGGFKEQVIGKSIDELKLTKVSASSLAPKGFNDAIEKIKAEAKS